ncbi:hypothetical protein SBOR_9933 [Sclerotinia borealis F-4128]|uniref:UDENN FLCN/SMCR8-type domain-containing protein n=1 Tax=Sclerotinia borealis (strain F-4128) TaxID=1432307 RepID=W9C1A5_SCLBF|nr:hypothetical protein SBOR_9933 [Sclerotinia borealis F-4128]
MVTEALPVGCTSCPEKDEYTARRPSISRSFRSEDRSSNTAARLPLPPKSNSIVEATRVAPFQPATRVDSNTPNKTGTKVVSIRPALHVDSNTPNTMGTKVVAIRPALHVDSNTPNTTGSAIETPPQSPRVPALQNTQNTTNRLRRDSSFRKTYPSEKPGPCENCALTLPKKTKDDAPSSPKPSPKPAEAGKLDNGPILRTRKPYERIAGQSTPPKSASSDSEDSECAIQKEEREPKVESRRPSIKGSDKSLTYTTREFLSHNHFVDYTSTHEPLKSASFSIIRQSCLRTLSCETLPPSSNTSPNITPASPFISSFSSHLTSSTTTSSGGPIFFGDPMAGYTTAYIFRIPDPTARGRRRVYALIALSTHKERMAMRTFSFLDAAFRDLADWISRLADEELARSESTPQSPRPGDERNGSVNSNSSSAFATGQTSTPTSSFLRGGNRGPDSRMVGASLKGRGLAELVGLPDFFLELHSRFVRLLAEMERLR